MAIVKKVVKSKGWPRNGCDGISWWQKNLITIQVNLVLIPSEAVIRQHKLT